MTSSSERSPEKLLAHAGWMRALALGLLHDPNDAEDVVQDATLVALLRPHQAPAAFGPWVGQVVRRLAWRRRRSELRRGDHERLAQAAGEQEDPAQTLLRLDLQRQLLDAVQSLEEPLRTTIVQRYFEGKSSAEIAAQSGLPPSTVRGHLARGLERLREKLDRESGSRRAWMALLAPLVPRGLAPGAPAWTLLTHGALTMSVAKTALFLGALTLGLAWWKLAPRGATRAPLAPAPELQPLAQRESDSSEEPVALAEERVAEPGVAAEAAAAEPELEPRALSTLASGRIVARVVDEHGGPWADAELCAFFGTSNGRPAAGCGTSAADGRLTVDVQIASFLRDEQGHAAGDATLVLRRAGCATLRLQAIVRAGESTQLGDLVLRESASVHGRVVDEQGQAVAAAAIGAVAAAELEALDATERERLVRVGSELLDTLVASQSRADGGFELDDIAPGRMLLWAHAPGHRYALSEPLELEPRQIVEELVLLLPRLTAEERIAGRVVGPDGKARPSSISRDLRSSRGHQIDFIETDPSGRFEFAVEDLDGVYELAAHDGFQEFAPARASAVRPGDVDVLLRFERGRRMLVVLRDEAGQPVEGAKLWIDGPEIIDQARAKELRPGELELDCPTGSFAVLVEARGFRKARSAELEGTSTPERIELRLLHAALVRGKVTAEGRPVAGARISAHEYDADGNMTVNGLRCSISPFARGECTSDEEGLFELPVDSSRSIVVRASSAGWVEAESVPMEAGRLAAGEPLLLELGRGGTIEGSVLEEAGRSAAGRIVGVHRGDGRARSQRTAEDGSFRFEGLMPGDWHVLLLEAEIPPVGGSYGGYSGSEPMPWSCHVAEGGTTHYDL